MKTIPRGRVSRGAKRVADPDSGPVPKVPAVVTPRGATAREGDGLVAEAREELAEAAGFNLAARSACSAWIALTWLTIRTSLGSGVIWPNEARLSRGGNSAHALGTSGQ